MTLTDTAQSAASINSKHRKVQALGRTAKEIAAVIGEDLIAVKDDPDHGEFMPWVEANCSFKDRAANNYMKIAKTKIARPCEFALCESIADVLALGNTRNKSKGRPSRGVHTTLSLIPKTNLNAHFGHPLQYAHHQNRAHIKPRN